MKIFNNAKFWVIFNMVASIGFLFWGTIVLFDLSKFTPFIFIGFPILIYGQIRVRNTWKDTFDKDYEGLFGR